MRRYLGESPKARPESVAGTWAMEVGEASQLKQRDAEGVGISKGTGSSDNWELGS